MSVTTEDDREGEAVAGRLNELACARDAASLALCCRVADDGELLTGYDAADAVDPLEPGASAAVARVQAAARGRRQRSKAEEDRAARAAVKVQAVRRGQAARRKGDQMVVS